MERRRAYAVLSKLADYVKSRIFAAHPPFSIHTAEAAAIGPTQAAGGSAPAMGPGT